jgi:type IV pilus assembly protein PilX
MENTQRGSVLIVAMVLLLAMTLIGMAGIEVTSLEEKMVFNLRDRQAAFEAAEAALLQAEEYLDETPSVSLPAFACGTNGYYEAGLDTCNEDANESLLWKKTWTDGCFITFTPDSDDEFSQLAALPRFVIEELADEQTDDSLLAGATKGQFVFYRITVMARGLTSTSEVRLQSVYKIKH